MLGRTTQAIRVQAVPQAAAAHPQQARRPREIAPALTQGVGEALGLVEGHVRVGGSSESTGTAGPGGGRHRRARLSGSITVAGSSRTTRSSRWLNSRTLPGQ